MHHRTKVLGTGEEGEVGEVRGTGYSSPSTQFSVNLKSSTKQVCRLKKKKKKRVFLIIVLSLLTCTSRLLEDSAQTQLWGLSWQPWQVSLPSSKSQRPCHLLRPADPQLRCLHECDPFCRAPSAWLQPSTDILPLPPWLWRERFSNSVKAQASGSSEFPPEKNHHQKIHHVL